MGYRLIKHLESSQYNRKLFYLDRGAIDLPPIKDFTSIMPGSEARSLSTGEKWILNTQFKWVWIGVGDGCCTGGNGSAGNGSGSGDGDGDVPSPGNEPTINGVTIAPQNISAAPGSQIAFQATIDGSNKLNQGITWTIKGQKKTGTTISPDGILTIDPDEPDATSITVRATSQGDTSKYAQAVVTIDADMPIEVFVTGVSITPVDAEIIRGRSMMFKATVTGANIDDPSVTWSITGQTSNSTYIDEDKGILYTSVDEGAAIILVTATSNADDTKSATTTVMTVLESEASNPAAISAVIVHPDAVRVGQGYSTKFAAEV